MLCCPRCHSGGHPTPPSHTWGTPAAAAAPTLAGPAPRPHGPAAPASFLAFTVCSRHTGLLCGKQTRKQAWQQLTGRRRRGDSADLVVLCGPPRIWTAGRGHGRPPPPSPPFPLHLGGRTGETPRLQACGAARHARVTGSDPLGKDTGVLRAELARPLREPEPVALTLTLRLPGAGAGHAGCFELCRADRPAGSPGGHLCYTLQGKPLCS